MSTEELCRICLQSGATIPIFEEDERNEKIISKMCNCFHEEVLEEECYPKKICTDCNTSLDSILNFIETYKRTNEILHERVNKINSYEEYYLLDVGAESESDIPLADIKIEFKVEDDETVDCLEEIDIKPVQLQKKLKRLTDTEIKRCSNAKTKPPKLKVKTETDVKDVKEKIDNVIKTKTIATSLLEGVYCWSGLRWSYVNKMTPQQSVSTTRDSIRKMKLPPPPRKKKACDPKRLCDLCGKVFADQKKLSLHKRMVHVWVPVKCDAAGCKHTSSSERNLKLHKLRKHSGKRDFICQQCAGAFSTKIDLNNHVRRMHIKPKKKKEYVCETCKKKYLSKVGLEIHERSVHTGVRPANCEVCAASFFHEMYLKEHMRLHTGETPFHCPICDRGYAQRGNMKSHMRQHRFRELDEETKAKLKPSYLKLLKY